ncbi:hypothetical protein N431DRAFT_455102 [Stipitochalara longipes BDJ]|nr:hypothetical protein N431DRAFT_455102 [Stipitochalara longipes BDJ]
MLALCFMRVFLQLTYYWASSLLTGNTEAHDYRPDMYGYMILYKTELPCDLRRVTRSHHEGAIILSAPRQTDPKLRVGLKRMVRNLLLHIEDQGMHLASGFDDYGVRAVTPQAYQTYFDGQDENVPPGGLQSPGYHDYGHHG